MPEALEPDTLAPNPSLAVCPMAPTDFLVVLGTRQHLPWKAVGENTVSPSSSGFRPPS